MKMLKNFTAAKPNFAIKRIAAPIGAEIRRKNPRQSVPRGWIGSYWRSITAFCLAASPGSRNRLGKGLACKRRRGRSSEAAPSSHHLGHVDVRQFRLELEDGLVPHPLCMKRQRQLRILEQAVESAHERRRAGCHPYA